MLKAIIFLSVYRDMHRGVIWNESKIESFLKFGSKNLLSKIDTKLGPPWNVLHHMRIKSGYQLFSFKNVAYVLFLNGHLKYFFLLISGDPVSWQQDPRDCRNNQHYEDSARVLPQLRQGATALHQQVDHFAIQRFVQLYIKA